MNPKIDSSYVVVITGASSGIGRQLSLQLAASKVQLVLLARNLTKLNDVALLCRNQGATVDVFSVDVTDAQRMQEIAKDVFRTKGRIDVWINNAGVGAIGSFTKVPLEDHARVMQTNFFGYLNGSYAAMQIFEKQQRGILINNASISSHISVPHSACYNASKFAIRGLTASLQQDLRVDEKKHIHVCQINPEVVDTPAFHHAANHSGVPIRIGMPMISASDVATRMIELMSNPQDEVFVAQLARVGVWGNKYFPRLAAAFLRWGARRFYKTSPIKYYPPTHGSLFSSVNDSSRSDGGWKSGQTQQI